MYDHSPFGLGIMAQEGPFTFNIVSIGITTLAIILMLYLLTMLWASNNELEHTVENLKIEINTVQSERNTARANHDDLERKLKRQHESLEGLVPNSSCIFWINTHVWIKQANPGHLSSDWNLFFLQGANLEMIRRLFLVFEESGFIKKNTHEVAPTQSDKYPGHLVCAIHVAEGSNIFDIIRALNNP